jgi:lia operon protein LiaG
MPHSTVVSVARSLPRPPMAQCALRAAIVAGALSTLSIMGLLALVGARPLAAQQPAAPGQAERFVLRGSQVAVYNIVGELRLEAGTGSDVVVEVTRRGDDAGGLRVETGSVRGREALRVIYPDDDIVYRDMDDDSRTTLHVREDGTFGDDHGRGGREVVIRGSGRGLEASADLVVRVPRGRQISAYLGAGEAFVTNVDGDVFVDVSSAPITAKGTRGRLRLDTGSGEVRVSDAEGEVDLDTGSGGVEVTNVRGRSLRVDAGSGSLRGEGIEVPLLRLDLGSGETRLSRVRAEDIDLDSGSGSVNLTLESDVKSMVIDAGSGSVTLGVPAALGAELDIDTGSGGIETDVPITVSRRSRDHLTGRIGDGSGRIRIDSGSGTVRIKRS